MKNKNRGEDLVTRSSTGAYWLAAFWLPGLVACDLKGDPAAYLRRGLASAEPTTSASPQVIPAPAASVPVVPAANPATGESSAAALSPQQTTGSLARPHPYESAARSPGAAPRVEPAFGQSAANAEAPQVAPPVAAASASSSPPSVPAPSSPALPGTAKRNVSVGGAAISGGNVSNAARVVAGLRSPLRACYSRETTDATGSIRFTLSIGSTGAVTNVKAQPSGELTNELVACTVAVVKNAKFEAPEGGTATLQMPATFVLQ